MVDRVDIVDRVDKGRLQRKSEEVGKSGFSYILLPTSYFLPRNVKESLNRGCLQ